MATDRGHALPPPPDLAERKLSLATIAAGKSWGRIGKSAFSPLYYSTSDGWRYSSPDMPGTLYLGEDEETCFWEVFWDDLVSRPPAEQRLDMAKVRERSFWEIALPRPFRVVDTTDATTLNQIGAHGGTFLGPYEVCQKWARALREHDAHPDGILYESARAKPRRCLALFSEYTETEAWADPGPGTPLPSVSALATLVRKYNLPGVTTFF